MAECSSLARDYGAGVLFGTGGTWMVLVVLFEPTSERELIRVSIEHLWRSSCPASLLCGERLAGVYGRYRVTACCRTRPAYIMLMFG